MHKSFNFYEVDWERSAQAIKSIRQKVFIIEQRFDDEMLEDRHDPYCYHILVTDHKDKPVACGRLNQDGQIGRIAVLMNYRGRGIGTLLLSELIDIAQNSQMSRLTLNAETELGGFYDQQKFVADGPVYMKQGVPYQRRTKSLI